MQEGGSFRAPGRNRAAAYALLLTAFYTTPSSASPWAREAGDFLIISRVDYFSADLEKEMTPEGFVANHFQRLESNTYIEFGLTPEITVGGKAIYGTTWLKRSSNVETATGFSEVELFGQYQILRSGAHAGAMKVAASIPSSFQSGVRVGLESNGVDFDITALYGRNLSIAPVKVFSASELGYKKRVSDSADQIRAQATIGVEPNARWLFLAEAFATLSLRNEKNTGADYDIVKLQPSIVWRASHRWAFQAGVSQEVAGRNIALGRTVFIGLWSGF